MVIEGLLVVPEETVVVEEVAGEEGAPMICRFVAVEVEEVVATLIEVGVVVDVVAIKIEEDEEGVGAEDEVVHKKLQCTSKSIQFLRNLGRSHLF